MKKSRSSRRTKSSRTVHELARLAAGLAASGSYKEYSFKINDAFEFRVTWFFKEKGQQQP